MLKVSRQVKTFQKEKEVQSMVKSAAREETEVLK